VFSVSYGAKYLIVLLDTMKCLTHLDLFSGIGGFALAAQWAGFKTIGFVEIDKYCQKVLRKHWPDVPIVEDIREIEKIKEIVANAERRTSEAEIEGWSKYKQDNENSLGKLNMASSREHRNISTVTARRIEPITLITGGFPCQPFSVAGKQRGKEDDRYLWPEMFNVIKEIRPAWVLGENVAGIVRMELDHCISDLEGIGYSTQAFVIPACAVNAPHRRDRVWIVAYSKRTRTWQDNGGLRQGFGRNGGRQKPVIANTQYAMPTRQRGYSREILRKPKSNRFNIASGKEWWAVEPELGRVAHGIPNRVDRLKCLGNAIVPQVAYQILKVIADIENI